MRRLLLLVALLACAAPASAQVAYDASASGVCSDIVGSACTTGSTVLTYPLTVGSGSNRQLAVFVFVLCGGADAVPAISGVTYAGTSLTQIATVSGGTVRRGYLFAWPTGSQPTSGANNVVVTAASSLMAACTTANIMHSGAISVTGVDQSTTFSDSAHTNTGSSGTASITLNASNANDLGVHAYCAGDSLSSPTGTQRYLNNSSGAFSCGNSVGATAAGGTTSLSATVASSDSWIALGGAFKSAGGGGGGATKSPLLGGGVF